MMTRAAFVATGPRFPGGAWNPLGKTCRARTTPKGWLWAVVDGKERIKTTRGDIR